MPGGVPVATMAIGKAGAINAALMAASIIGSTDKEVQSRLIAWREAMKQKVLDSSDSLGVEGP